jgi:hypothetical protein
MGERTNSSIMFDFGTRWRWVFSFTSRPFYPGKEPLLPIIYETEGGLRAGLDAVDKRKIFYLCRKSNLDQPARTLLPCQLCYSGSSIGGKKLKSIMVGWCLMPWYSYWNYITSLNWLKSYKGGKDTCILQHKTIFQHEARMERPKSRRVSVRVLCIWAFYSRSSYPLCRYGYMMSFFMKTILIRTPNIKFQENPSSSTGIKTTNGRTDRQFTNLPVCDHFLHAMQITENRESARDARPYYEIREWLKFRISELSKRAQN